MIFHSPAIPWRVKDHSSDWVLLEVEGRSRLVLLLPLSSKHGIAFMCSLIGRAALANLTGHHRKMRATGFHARSLIRSRYGRNLTREDRHALTAGLAGVVDYLVSEYTDEPVCSEYLPANCSCDLMPARNVSCTRFRASVSLQTRVRRPVLDLS